MIGRADYLNRRNHQMQATTKTRLEAEIEALKRFGAQYPKNEIVQASIAGQINALTWALYQ